MTEQEYREQIKQIELNCEQRKSSLAIKFAQSNCHVEIGDIVKDHASCIKVERIRFYAGILGTLPEAAFSGPRLTKKMEPFKNGDIVNIYQSNVIEHIKGEK
jgi:hypothetical protein